MLFAWYGLSVTERELRELCDCTFMGTDAFQTVEVARQYGFLNSAKHTLTMKELDSLVEGGDFPIVHLNLAPIDGIYQPHAVVVVAVTPFSVVVNDPATSERLIPREVFSVAWSKRHNLAIVIKP
jgi:ABC-type bacteriocin/lantibiotic exporter with double-glycine peptidase domain